MFHAEDWFFRWKGLASQRILSMSTVKSLMKADAFKKHGRGPDKKKRKPKGGGNNAQSAGRNVYNEKLIKDVNTSAIFPKSGMY